MICNQHPFESSDILLRFCAVINTERVFCAASVVALSVDGSTRDPKPLLTVDVVRAVAIALLGGVVVQAAGVSAGDGKVIDWREVKSGWTMLDNADAYDTARLFVDLVGVEAALEALAKHGMVLESHGDAQPKREAPKVHAYIHHEHGGYPASNIQRDIARHLNGRCVLSSNGIISKNGEHHKDCSTCQNRCGLDLLGFSEGVKVGRVWGSDAIELRWYCPGCKAEVSQDTTPIGSLLAAKEVKADPLCYRCRS